MENLNPRIFLKHLLESGTEAEEGKDINMASHEPEWANKIIRYLKDDELLENKDGARKVKIRVS